MAILVFGCTGYLGSSISSHLFDKGLKVIGVCRKFPKKNFNFKKKFHQIFEGDITNEKFINKILRSNFDSVVYTISLNHKDSEKNLDRALKINFFPLLNVCNKLVSSKLKVRFIYFSTMQIYGDYSSLKLISEKQNKNNKNVYALTHSLCEDVLSNLSYNINFRPISLRLSNGYGYPELNTCDCWWLVANDFCRNVSKKSIININSDGSPLRDFIHISDIARIVEKIIKTKKKLPKVMNLASGITMSMLEIADLVQKAAYKLNIKSDIYIKGNKISKIKLLKRLEKVKSIKKFRISTSYMKTLKLDPKIDIVTGIKNTLLKLNNEK